MQNSFKIICVYMPNVQKQVSDQPWRIQQSTIIPVSHKSLQYLHNDEHGNELCINRDMRRHSKRQKEWLVCGWLKMLNEPKKTGQLISFLMRSPTLWREFLRKQGVRSTYSILPANVSIRWNCGIQMTLFLHVTSTVFHALTNSKC